MTKNNDRKITDYPTIIVDGHVCWLCPLAHDGYVLVDKASFNPKWWPNPYVDTHIDKSEPISTNISLEEKTSKIIERMPNLDDWPQWAVEACEEGRLFQTMMARIKERETHLDKGMKLFQRHYTEASWSLESDAIVWCVSAKQLCGIEEQGEV